MASTIQHRWISIPSELIGSIPRTPELITARIQHESDLLSTDELHDITGSVVLTDGEQRKPSCLTYPINEFIFDHYKFDDKCFQITYNDGHIRMLPRLIKAPFQYATFAYKYLDLVKQFTHKPVKQAIIAASTLSLVYAPHILKMSPIDNYSHEEFLKDLIHDAEKDIRLCLEYGAHVVQLDFVGARLSLKMDSTGKLLKEFIDINNRVLDRFTEAEQKKIGVHVCPGSDCDSHQSKQAATSNAARITSFLAKQANQVIRISALTQIIDLLPTLIEHVNILCPNDDMLGLNLRLLHEMQQNIQSLFEPQITITQTSVCRALYFHGYLLEQTLKIFDISSLERHQPIFNQMIGSDIEVTITREILLLHKILITKEDLYSSNGNRKVDRNIGNRAFETLVSEGLLIKDYFIYKSTNRPIQCFAKYLPGDDTERHTISNKLQAYSISLSHYLESSQSVGIAPHSKLTSIGQKLFSKMAYSTICDVNVSTTMSMTLVPSQTLSIPNNTISISSRTTVEIPSNNQNRQSSSSTPHIGFLKTYLHLKHLVP